jgi:hypothetical protein
MTEVLSICVVGLFVGMLFLGVWKPLRASRIERLAIRAFCRENEAKRRSE